MYIVEIEKNTTSTLTLYDDDTNVRVGTLNFEFYDRFVHINETNIKDRFQGMGYGRIMFESFREYIIGLNDPNIWYMQLTAAKGSKDFWSKMGFKHIYNNKQLMYKYVMVRNVRDEYFNLIGQ